MGPPSAPGSSPEQQHLVLYCGRLLWESQAVVRKSVSCDPSRRMIAGWIYEQGREA